MLAASQGDEECRPNTITFSSLITACERGGRVDRALHWYHQMEERGVEPDHIIYRYAGFPSHCAGTLCVTRTVHAHGCM